MADETVTKVHILDLQFKTDEAENYHIFYQQLILY
jgi:hypothetical protein